MKILVIVLALGSLAALYFAGCLIRAVWEIHGMREALGETEAEADELMRVMETARVPLDEQEELAGDIGCDRALFRIRRERDKRRKTKREGH